MSRSWMTLFAATAVFLMFAGRARSVQEGAGEPAPGVVVGARLGLSLDGHAGVFVVSEVSAPWARLELDPAFARDRAELPVLPGLLASSASALEGLDLEEAKSVLDRLRGASEDLEERARSDAEARVAESRANPLWVNFDALEGFVLLAAAKEEAR